MIKIQLENFDLVTVFMRLKLDTGATIKHDYKRGIFS